MFINEITFETIKWTSQRRVVNIMVQLITYRYTDRIKENSHDKCVWGVSIENNKNKDGRNV